MPRRGLIRFLAVTAIAVAVAACSQDDDADADLQQRVSAAIRAASDLPSGGLDVAVEEGVVTVTGSLDCEDCGGNQTPAGSGTIQQSLGAVIRAVPGVERIEFDLQ
jgi:hypothetical protein